MFEKVKEILGSDAFKMLEENAPNIVSHLKDIPNLNSPSVAIFIFQMLIDVFNHTHSNLNLLGAKMKLDAYVFDKLKLLEQCFCETIRKLYDTSNTSSDVVVPVGN